jgi:hypothetical protein
MRAIGLRLATIGRTKSILQVQDYSKNGCVAVRRFSHAPLISSRTPVVLRNEHQVRCLVFDTQLSAALSGPRSVVEAEPTKAQ